MGSSDWVAAKCQEHFSYPLRESFFLSAAKFSHIVFIVFGKLFSGPGRSKLG